MILSVSTNNKTKSLTLRFSRGKTDDFVVIPTFAVGACAGYYTLTWGWGFRHAAIEVSYK